METTETAIRMVGQLLLHHPTTGGMFKRTTGELVTPIATSKATIPIDTCAFCYVGAIRATAVYLGKNQQKLWEACDAASGEVSVDGEYWDNMSQTFRANIAIKLANYKKPQ